MDEYQDINDIQFEIITEFYKNNVIITAVGDDAQNIYSFRGSNIEHIFNFPKCFENNVKHKLVKNYRSTPEIIKFANHSIEKNKFQMPKKMIPFHSSLKAKPTVEYCYSKQAQNTYILNAILNYIALGEIKSHDIAILSPINMPLRLIEEELIKNNIPCVLLDSESDVKAKIKENHVCLSTIHKAKGLEWSVVFLIDMNDEIFPGKKNTLDIYESRRLFYVAVTRAKIYLHILFTMAYNCLFVTRFISELNTDLYDFKNFNSKYVGISEAEHGCYELSVTELIKNLDENDYMKIRKLNLIPNLRELKTNLYTKYTYDEQIIKDDLYSDFGIFIDCLISRMMGGIDENSNGLLYESAILAVAAVELTSSEHKIYKKYIYNFSYNVRDCSTIESKIENTNLLIEWLENRNHLFFDTKVKNIICKIDNDDKDRIFNIFQKLKQSADRYKIPIEKIPIFNQRFLPEHFKEQMEKHLELFTNGNNNWFDIIESIWEIAKCDKIVREERRRLLYMETDKSIFEKYKPLFNEIFDLFVSVIKKGAKCHKHLKSSYGVFGEIDILNDDCVIEVKTSVDNVKIEWIIQLSCYVQLCRENNIPINYIKIFNPLRGELFTYDISNWNNGEELLIYLLDKREKLINRTIKE